MNRTQHELAGKTVVIHPHNEYEGAVDGAHFSVEDYWENVAGKSWMNSGGNPACLAYAMRSVGLPIDNEVIYGKIVQYPLGVAFGYLIHESEIGEITNE